MIGHCIEGLCLKSMDSKTSQELLSLVDTHGVVVIKKQDLNPKELISFGNGIGDVAIYPQENYHHPEHPEIFVSSNTEIEGKKMGVSRTGGYWHIDTAFLEKPHIFTILQPKIIPSSPRTTHFIDLVEALKKFNGATIDLLRSANAIHSGRWRYKIRETDIGMDVSEILQHVDTLFPPVVHPAIVCHPITGKESLYMSSGFTIGLKNRTTNESMDELLSSCLKQLESPDDIIELCWELGDVILWDNRQVSHRSGRKIGLSDTNIEGKTAMYRVTAFDRRGGL
jgi:taurine dioxygenase